MALDFTTPRDRIRHAVGDVGETPLHPDGLDYYTALLAISPDEVTAWREAARGLAMYLLEKPIQLGSSGKSLAYDVARVGRLLAIANGTTPYPFDDSGNPIAPAQGGYAPVEVIW